MERTVAEYDFFGLEKSEDKALEKLAADRKRTLRDMQSAMSKVGIQQLRTVLAGSGHGNTAELVLSPPGAPNQNHNSRSAANLTSMPPPRAKSAFCNFANGFQPGMAAASGTRNQVSEPAAVIGSAVFSNCTSRCEQGVPTTTTISVAPIHASISQLAIAEPSLSSAMSRCQLEDSRVAILHNSRSSSPMTIFYNGAVVVIDVSPEQAETVFKFAERAYAGMSPIASVETRFNDGNLSVSKSPERGVNFVHGQTMHNLWGPQHMGQMYQVPIARKQSLRRFLEKRKERLTSNFPYTRMDGSTTGSPQSVDVPRSPWSQ